MPCNTISRQPFTCKRASLNACIMQACICLHLYPHYSLLFYLCPLANIYLDSLCNIHTCAMCNFFCVPFKNCVRETSDKVRRLCLLCTEITICFHLNEKYMLLKPIFYSQDLFQTKVCCKGKLLCCIHCILLLYAVSYNMPKWMCKKRTLPLMQTIQLSQQMFSS